jgi:hypothetical protein
MTEDNSTKPPDGPSFRGRSLEGADFAGQDLRGADFTGADLRSANFRDAQFGVRPHVGVVFLGLALLASLCAGMAIGLVIEQTRERLSADQWDELAEGGSMGLILVLLVGLTFWRGIDFAMRVVIVVYVAVLAVNIVANLLWDEVEWLVALRATALIIFLALAITVGMLGRVIGGVFGAWSIALVAILGGLASGQTGGGAGGIVVAVSLVLISKRALRGDPRDRTLRRIAHQLVGRWGTRFVDADLTGADFTGTDASECGVRGATVDGVTWDPDLPLPLDLPESAVPS